MRLPLSNGFDLLPPLPGLPDPLTELGLGRSPVRRRRAAEPELTPEEQREMLESLAPPTVSGVERVANLLDTPGAWVRGLLVGRLPGGERVSGRELLEHYGLLGPNRPGFDWGDVAGFAAEVLLDPLTYLTFGVGALTKAGKLAKMAGILAKAERGGAVAGEAARAAKGAKVLTLARRAAAVGPRVARMRTTLRQAIERGGSKAQEAVKAAAKAMRIGDEELAKLMEKPLGGLVGISPIPMGQPRWVLGKAGGPGERIARAMDELGQKLLYSKPGRHISALFDPSVSPLGRAATSAEMQRKMRAMAPDLEEALAEATAEAVDIARFLDSRGLGSDRRAMTAIVAALERGVPLPQHLEQKGVGELVVRLRKIMDDALADEQHWGLNSKQLSDVVGYFTRQLFRFGERPEMSRTAARAGWLGQLVARHPMQRMRGRMLTGHPGGTEFLNELSVRPAYSGLGKLSKEQLREKVQQLIAEYGPSGKGWLKPMPQATEQLKGAALARAQKKWQQDVRDLVKWMASLDPRHVKEGIPIFSQDIAGLVRTRLSWSKRSVETAKQALQLIAETMRPKRLAQPGDVPISKALSAAGLTGEGAVSRLLETIAEYAPPELRRATRPKHLKRLVVPGDIAKDIANVMRGFAAPEEVSRIGQMLRGFLDWWRAHQTVYWPAFHSRNVNGGLVANALVTGKPMAVLRGFAESWRMLRGRPVSSWLKIPLVKERGIRDAKQATEFIADLMAKHGVTQAFKGDVLDLGAEAAGAALRPLGGEIPGMSPFPGVLGAIKRSFRRRGALNPLDVETFGPIVAGRQVSLGIETGLRGSLFVTLLREGYDPAAAAAKVRLVHVDYSRLTPFERNVMRHVIPFYSFARGQAEYLARELMERPGGPLAQAIRAENRMRGEPQLLPDYLRQTLAAPIPPGTPLIGPKPGGDPRFFTGAGLMFEDPLQFLGGGPGLLGLSRGILQELGSRAAPYVKGPIEWMTGTSLFQAGPRGGRLLEDMDPLLGRLLANVRDVATGAKPGYTRPVTFPGSKLVEQVIAQVMPRPFTTARTLTDPRKGLLAKLVNVATGARLYDLPQRTQEALIREAVEERLRRTGLAKTFERLYVSPEDIEGLSPVEQAEIKRDLAMLRLLAKRATARKKGEPLEPIVSW